MLFFSREQRRLLAACLLLAALAGAAYVYVRHDAASGDTDPLLIEASPTAPEANDSILVHVAGRVRTPGVYRFDYGSRVQDAIRSAGGATADGDPQSLNLAAFLKDGEKIEVPLRTPPEPDLAHTPTGNSTVPPPPAFPSRAGAATNPGVNPSASSQPAKPPVDWLRKHRVSLNRASTRQLQQLPGIGPAMADRILEYRKTSGGFSTLEDLKNVTGIGPKRFDALRELVTL